MKEFLTAVGMIIIIALLSVLYMGLSVEVAIGYLIGG